MKKKMNRMQVLKKDRGNKIKRLQNYWEITNRKSVTGELLVVGMLIVRVLIVRIRLAKVSVMWMLMVLIVELSMQFWEIANYEFLILVGMLAKVLARILVEILIKIVINLLCVFPFYVYSLYITL